MNACGCGVRTFAPDICEDHSSQWASWRLHFSILLFSRLGNISYAENVHGLYHASLFKSFPAGAGSIPSQNFLTGDALKNKIVQANEFIHKVNLEKLVLEISESIGLSRKL